MAASIPASFWFASAMTSDQWNGLWVQTAQRSAMSLLSNRYTAVTLLDRIAQGVDPREQASRLHRSESRRAVVDEIDLQRRLFRGNQHPGVLVGAEERFAIEPVVAFAKRGEGAIHVPVEAAILINKSRSSEYRNPK